MNINSKVKELESLINMVGEMPCVVSTRLGSPDGNGCLRVVIQLEMNRIEYSRNGSLGYVYMPKEGQTFDLRTLTNPIRKLCRTLQVEFSIVTPNRYYKSRKSTVNEFLGYESSEINLDLM